MTNLRLIASLFVVLAVAVAGQRKPNIVFILADDLGWNDVGFHGSNEMWTPNIDALAYSGVILNSHYSENLCTPSRAALLTGRYPIHTGTQHNVIVEASPWGLPLQEKLMPQHLERLGYVSHALGKWHLGFYKKDYTPTYRGFISHYGFWNSHQDYFTHKVQASFSPFEGMDMRDNMTTDWSSVGKYTTRILTHRAEKLIHEHNEKKPLFLYLAHLAVHAGNYEDPLQAPDETVRMFSHIKSKEKRVYAAMMWELDQSIGTLVKALKKKGILDNTIITFVSDNGAATRGLHKNTGSNWPLKGEKATPWEGALRTVACIWSAKLQKKNSVLKNLMHLTDWLPTLYSAAGGNLTNLGNIDGISQWEYLTRDVKEPRREILQNIDEVYGYSAMRFGPYKYVNGTAFLGYLDNWFGVREDTELTYNISAVMGSEVIHILHNVNRSNLTDDKIFDLRNEAKIKCKDSKSTVVRECDSKKSPCLFNIEEDPCETDNLYDLFPEVVINIENRLAGFITTMVPPGNQRAESIANPKYFNNTWMNWGDFEDLKSRHY